MCPPALNASFPAPLITMTQTPSSFANSSNSDASRRRAVKGTVL